ncbi:unnamed protein product [Lasius platythorax]|uniref:Uncharacterized protein n=1 Tax=Lasius platythorax TaxID=488582 RepID=A0AAV2N3G7_9HYME
MRDASTQIAIILGDGSIEVVFDEIINAANNDDEINNDDENNYIKYDGGTTLRDFGLASVLGVTATHAAVTALRSTVGLPLIGCIAGVGLTGGALGYGVYCGAKKSANTMTTRDFSSQFPELKMVCWHDVEKK